jgi:hypothetical protein
VSEILPFSRFILFPTCTNSVVPEVGRLYRLPEFGRRFRLHFLKASGYSSRSLTDLVNAEVEKHRAESRLRQIGVEAEVSTKSRTETVVAPVSGSVIDLNVAPGAYWNDATAALMTVADLSTILVTANVPEKDTAPVAKGQPTQVRCSKAKAFLLATFSTRTRVAPRSASVSIIRRREQYPAKEEWPAVAELNALGLNYTLTNGAGKQAKTGSGKGKGAIKAAACPICEFQTAPPHDGRTHRNQKKKSPFSVAELKEKGLVKV